MGSSFLITAQQSKIKIKSKWFVVDSWQGDLCIGFDRNSIYQTVYRREFRSLIK